MSFWHQYSFQDSASSIMENMSLFYDYAMLIIVMIIFLIFYMLIFMIMNMNINRFLLEGQTIEIIWTILPMFFLIFLAFPSLKLLYMTDELNSPNYTFKVIGHQWYWEYEYSGILNLNNTIIETFDVDNFDSMMKKSAQKLDLFRLLDVNKHFYLPMNNQIRLVIMSDDVIHSFAVPSLGVKVDAVPGRLNQVSICVNRAGLFYGQCSEICGVNHSFMPIVLEVIDVKNFINMIFMNIS